MANVPYSPNVSVAPSTAPTPGQNINPPAEAFGASVVGQGLGEVGKAVGQTGDALTAYAQQFQAINNKQAADAHWQGTVDKQANIITEYQQNNRGMAAADNLGTALTSLEQARNEGSQGLSPLAQVEYEANTRRNEAAAVATLRTFAATERKTAIIGTSQATIATNQLTAVNAYDTDPATFTGALQAIHNEVTNQTQPGMLGLSPEEAALKEHQDIGAVFQAIIKQKYDAGDIPGAQAVFDARKNDMTFEQATSVAGALRSGARQFVVQSAVQAYLSGQPITDTRPQVGVGSTDYISAVNAHEGTAPNPRSSAVGAGQFVNGTWLTVLKSDPSFAADIAGKSDAEILALRGDRSIAERAITAYGNINARALAADGLPTTNATVGLAHGFGSAGAATLLRADPSALVSSVLTPAVMAANPNLVGKTVQQVVSSYQSHYGNAPWGSGASTAPAPPRVTAPPPPAITANEDPAQAKADSDTYIQNWIPKVFANDPVMAGQVSDALRSAAAVRIQQLQATQTAATARLIQAVQANQGSTPIVDTGSLRQAYPGASDDLALLPPEAQTRVQSAINSTAAGFGSTRTPAMDANARRLVGMTADQLIHTDLNHIPGGLSQSDYIHFAGLQQSLARSAQDRADRDAKLNTYLSDPLVSTAVNTRWPDANARNDLNTQAGKDYTSFLGALRTRIDALQAQDGKPPTTKEITPIAQDLLLHQEQWAPMAGAGTAGGAFAAATRVPAAAEADIRATFSSHGVANPTAAQIQQAYQQYYAGH